MSLENKEKQENRQTEEKKESATQATENGLPKTQEELDAIIDARLARERKKMAKQQHIQKFIKIHTQEKSRKINN